MKMFSKSKNEDDESQQTRPLEVLIIDDNEQITKMISSFLDMSNHECTVVNDGKEGLELVKTNQYDSIVLDLAMPEFDGYEILNTLAKEDPSQLRKVIVLTASSVSIESVKKFKELGISSCLQKPVDIDQLLAKINSVVA
ncbi:MAG: response regulator transcription factor [Candidatus Nitrosomaritimum yanchengensis]